MIFKILPLIVLLGIGVRFIAKIAAVNAHRKWLKAKQAGRLDQHLADKERFWRRVDQASIAVAAIAAAWYAVGIVMWLLPT